MALIKDFGGLLFIPVVFLLGKEMIRQSRATGGSSALVTSLLAAAGIVGAAFVTLCLPVVLYVAYAITVNRRPAEPEAKEALRDGSGIIVIEEDWGVAFVPSPIDASGKTRKGLLYFQGALVDHVAYAPVLRAIAAEARATVVLLRSPLRLAPLRANRLATTAVARFKHVQVWAVGGHSMGGPAAADLLGHLEGATVAGLCLHASYLLRPLPDLDAPLSVLQVLGDRDGILTAAKNEAAQKWLPPKTKSVTIHGGNHAGFACYGAQTYPRPDGERTISSEAQQAKIVSATAAWLQTLGAVAGMSQRRVVADDAAAPRPFRRQSSSLAEWLSFDATPFSDLGLSARETTLPAGDGALAKEE